MADITFIKRYNVAHIIGKKQVNLPFSKQHFFFSKSVFCLSVSFIKNAFCYKNDFWQCQQPLILIKESDNVTVNNCVTEVI